MVIKEKNSRTADLELLTKLLERKDLTRQQSKLIDKEISMIKYGDSGEKKAAYFINELFDDWHIAHDLRIEVNDRVAQIDHLAIKDTGVVILFETKNYSNDIKIDDDGNFFYMDQFIKSYKSFPSPIEQSKRHENILNKVFENIDFVPLKIFHFVLFDHKANIIKPSSGFENVCYPDMAKATYKKAIDQMGVLETFSKVGRMFNKKIKKGLSSEEAIRCIISSYHKPLKIDYKLKFGVKNDPSFEGSASPDTSVTSENTDENMLTLAKFAKSLGRKTFEIEASLIEKDYLEKNQRGLTVPTKNGRDAGLKLLKGRNGYFLLAPSSLDKIFL